MTPLTGLRVIVRAEGVAAAYAARMLGTMGAAVTLVEPPEGSALRREPPFLPDSPHPPTPSPEGERKKVSALFAYLAAGMRSYVADPTSDQGRAALTGLLADADIFIDDTPVAKRAALGLGEAEIAARHPGLIHVSALPFGAFGRKAGWKGTDLTLQHASGEGYLLPNGLSVELFPDRPPVKIHGHFAELQGGIAAALGALTALWARDEVGGQYVDISSQDATLAVGAFAIQRLGDGQVEHRVERSFRYGGVLPCADGFVELLTLEQRQWDGLVELLGRPAWALDPALADSLERSRRGAELNHHIRAWAKVRKVAEIVAAGQAVNVPLAPYNTPADVLHDRHERERGLFAAVPVDGFGMLDMLVSPFHFGGAPLSLGGGPPALGDAFLPGTGRGTTEGGGGAQAGSKDVEGRAMPRVPLHHALHGPPPRTGEES